MVVGDVIEVLKEEVDFGMLLVKKKWWLNKKKGGKFSLDIQRVIKNFLMFFNEI